MAECDFFKEDFKYLKRKNPPPDLSNVIDFYTEAKNNSVDLIDFAPCKLRSAHPCPTCSSLGLVDHQVWELYVINNLDGFIYIKNPFLNAGQKIWIRKCLQLYPRKPSVTNLHLHHPQIDDIWSLRDHNDLEKRGYLLKLCWTTLGYHHDWDTKVYNPCHRSEFPSCLKELSQHIAHCLGFKDYSPEAAIVNYYNSKSSLGIHNDHSEEDHNAPIISFSFGQTGIFLIGTQNKTEKPMSLFLRSGDIIILSGVSRLAYHAVPCIKQENFCEKYFEKENDETWEPFHEYIKSSRINISVRQVYKKKQSS